MKPGILYTRTHESYDKYDVIKVGICNCSIERDGTYATGEYVRGQFMDMYQIPIELTKLVEDQLHVKFSDLHRQKSGGTEFFDTQISALIEPWLITLDVDYHKLTDEEMCDLNRQIREKCNVELNKAPLLHHCETEQDESDDDQTFVPRDYQHEIIAKSCEHFQHESKGILNLVCGLGKTLISLWIAQGIHSDTILIGIPNTELLTHWTQVIRMIFKDVALLVVKGGVNIEMIKQFLIMEQSACIVLTTYSSSHKVYTASQHANFTFDLKILDEAHHLTTPDLNVNSDAKTYVQTLNIPTKKQLALTATLKQLENVSGTGVIVSNDDVDYFGKVIDKKGLLWGINNQIICDYAIQTIVTNETQLENQFMKFNIMDDNDKRLFLSAFASLKSIFDGNSHHLLIYSNSKCSSRKLTTYINLLIDDAYFDIPNIYMSNYDGDMKQNKKRHILNKFESSQYGIISCVYCLNEGWDFPVLDGVVFSENMASIIRILQAALRASRKNKNEPNKISKIILPILTRDDDWLENGENPDLKKVIEIIHQMGVEDETIFQKIKVFKMNTEKIPSKKIYYKGDLTEAYDFGEYDDEFTKKLRLRTVKRIAPSMTFDKIRIILKDKQIRSKEEYYELCDVDCRLPKDPEFVFKERFSNWIEFLSIERVYYNLDACKENVNRYLKECSTIKREYLNLDIVCEALCKHDKKFPPNGLWVEYYGVHDLRDIIVIVNKKKVGGAC
jgi:superfamily II DNA or RNA helicase